MFKRLINIPLQTRKSFFLFGPRGTGKTTWLRQNLPEQLYINLLESESYTRLSANPGLLRRMIPPNYTDWIVVDEIQRVPELLNEIHDLIESKNHSSQSKVRYSTGIPKTSLGRILDNLVGKKVISIEKVGKLKKISLTDWFLGKD